MKIDAKVWVVTGGGSGMGRDLTLQLLSKGAQVAMVDIHEDAMQETIRLAGEAGKKVSAHVLNITNKDAVLAFPQKVIERHGAIHCII